VSATEVDTTAIRARFTRGGPTVHVLCDEVDALRATLARVRVILDEWREEGEIRDALYAALDN
jgi:hypothetical protein